MPTYRVTFQGEGYETYYVEADSQSEALAACEGEWPTDTRVEGAEFLSADEVD